PGEGGGGLLGLFEAWEEAEPGGRRPQDDPVGCGRIAETTTAAVAARCPGRDAAARVGAAGPAAPSYGLARRPASVHARRPPRCQAQRPRVSAFARARSSSGVGAAGPSGRYVS